MADDPTPFRFKGTSGEVPFRHQANSAKERCVCPKKMVFLRT